MDLLNGKNNTIFRFESNPWISLITEAIKIGALNHLSDCLCSDEYENFIKNGLTLEIPPKVERSKKYHKK
jgi:hypothetical protein